MTINGFQAHVDEFNKISSVRELEVWCYGILILNNPEIYSLRALIDAKPKFSCDLYSIIVCMNLLQTPLKYAKQFKELTVHKSHFRCLGSTICISLDESNYPHEVVYERLEHLRDLLVSLYHKPQTKSAAGIAFASTIGLYLDEPLNERIIDLLLSLGANGAGVNASFDEYISKILAKIFESLLSSGSFAHWARFKLVQLYSQAIRAREFEAWANMLSLISKSNESVFQTILVNDVRSIISEGIRVANYQARINSFKLLQCVFPLVDIKQPTAQYSRALAKNVFLLQTGLNDIHPIVRANAVKVSLEIIGQFHDTFPLYCVNDVLDHILIKNIRDKNSPLSREYFLNLVPLFLESQSVSYLAPRLIKHALQLANNSNNKVRLAAAELICKLSIYHKGCGIPQNLLINMFLRESHIWIVSKNAYSKKTAVMLAKLLSAIILDTEGDLHVQAAAVIAHTKAKPQLLPHMFHYIHVRQSDVILAATVALEGLELLGLQHDLDPDVYKKISPTGICLVRLASIMLNCYFAQPKAKPGHSRLIGTDIPADYLLRALKLFGTKLTIICDVTLEFIAASRRNYDISVNSAVCQIFREYEDLGNSQWISTAEFICSMTNTGIPSPNGDSEPSMPEIENRESSNHTPVNSESLRQDDETVKLTPKLKNRSMTGVESLSLYIGEWFHVIDRICQCLGEENHFVANYVISETELQGELLLSARDSQVLIRFLKAVSALNMLMDTDEHLRQISLEYQNNLICKFPAIFENLRAALNQCDSLEIQRRKGAFLEYFLVFLAENIVLLCNAIIQDFNSKKEVPARASTVQSMITNLISGLSFSIELSGFIHTLFEAYYVLSSVTRTVILPNLDFIGNFLMNSFDNKPPSMSMEATFKRAEDSVAFRAQFSSFFNQGFHDILDVILRIIENHMKVHGPYDMAVHRTLCVMICYILQDRDGWQSKYKVNDMELSLIEDNQIKVREALGTSYACSTLPAPIANIISPFWGQLIRWLRKIPITLAQHEGCSPTHGREWLMVLLEQFVLRTDSCGTTISASNQELVCASMKSFINSTGSDCS